MHIAFKPAKPLRGAASVAVAQTLPLKKETSSISAAALIHSLAPSRIIGL